MRMADHHCLDCLGFVWRTLQERNGREVALNCVRGERERGEALMTPMRPITDRANVWK